MSQDAVRRDSSPEITKDSRARRSDGDWQIDDAKRTRSTSVIALSDSEHSSDGDKKKVEEPRVIADKPKPPDVRKRGRPRKSVKDSVKSPKNHRTQDEGKGSSKKNRQRSASSPKKKTVAKAAVDSSDDEAGDVR